MAMTRMDLGAIPSEHNFQGCFPVGWDPRHNQHFLAVVAAEKWPWVEGKNTDFLDYN